MDFWDWYDRARQEAADGQVPIAELEWLIRNCTPLDQLGLRLRSPDYAGLNWQKLAELWYQRLTDRVPVQYLVGKVGWRHLVLNVHSGVLIPRPETELIPEIVAERVAHPSGLWGDLGTGSGAIAFGLAISFPEIQVYGIDLSKEALLIATSNCQQLELTDRVQFFDGNWFLAIPDFLRKEALFDGIVANPPYIPSNELGTLAPEVRNHEPQLALDGGVDGLAAIGILIRQGAFYLRSGGFWLTEVMSGQASSVQHLLEEHGSYKEISIHSDLSGIDRFVSAFREEY